MLTEIQEQELIANVKAVTDRMAVVDRIIKDNRLGVETVMVFRCGESGLLYPGDYIRQWGRLYGIGLGPHPVSESLQSEYEVDPPRITPSIESIEQIMHPLRVSGVQMDLDLVSKEEALLAVPVIAIEDRNMKLRARILYAKQLNNPRGRLGIIRAAWAQERRD